MKSTAKLGIGTVQLGLPYGVSNLGGQPTGLEANLIIELARRLGVRFLDTSVSYGDAERVLGGCNLDGFLVTTKTLTFDCNKISDFHAAALVKSFQESLERLGCKQVYGLLVHNAQNLLSHGGANLVGALDGLKAYGLVEKIGVSVYDSKQIDAVLRLFRPDIIQLPVSVFDQRLIKSGHLDILKTAGVEIHVRSVFLQGLLLMPMDRLPRYFDPIRPLLAKWHAEVEAHQLNPIQAALAFVRDLPWVDVVLVGVESCAQLEGCHAEFISGKKFDGFEFACNVKRFVNPSCWEL